MQFNQLPLHREKPSKFIERIGYYIIVWTVDNKVVANHINTIDESIAITTNHPEWLW
ncbi:hypothetical protein [Ureibacillus acetophenoni]